MWRAGHQRFKAVDIVRLSFLEFLEFVGIEEELFFLIGVLMGTFAGLKLHMSEDMCVEFRVINELYEREEEEVVMLKYQVRLDLV